MSRRMTWAIAGGVTALVLAAAAIWIWQASSSPSSTGPLQSASPSPSIDPSTLAQQQLDEYLEDCTAVGTSHSSVPDGCGIRIPWGTEFAAVDSIRFRIEELPALRLVDGGFAADGGVLIATVSGTGQDGTQKTETYRTDSWAVRGDATVTGDRVELDVW